MSKVQGPLVFGTASLLPLLINYLRNRDRSLSCDPERVSWWAALLPTKKNISSLGFRISDCVEVAVSTTQIKLPFDQKNRLTKTESEIRTPNLFSPTQTFRSTALKQHKIRNSKSEIRNSEILSTCSLSFVPGRDQLALPSEFDSTLRYLHRQVQVVDTFAEWRRRRRGHLVCDRRARG